MKNIKFLLFAGIIAGFAACSNQIQNEQADLAIPISVEDVKNQSIQQYINTTGTVKATTETTLSTETSGNYHLMNNPATGRTFKLGDRVKAGQVIIKLEDKEYEIGIAIETKRLNLEISQQEYEKQQSLYEKGGVTLRELRDAEVSKISAQYNYENAQIQLEKMSVVAPISGVIVDLPYYTTGTRISSGVSVVSLMSYEKMYLEFNLPEKNIADIQLGQQVLVTSYTLENDTLPGIISELSPAISTETRTFQGKLTIDNPSLLLRPGMFVKADIITASKDSTIVIPKDIILSNNRGKMVYIVERSNARERRITLGIENQDYVEVIDGLSVNDQLVVKGYETLRNGSKIKVIR